MNPHSTNRNRYFENRKNPVIFTPPPLCKWIADIIQPELSNVQYIFDPAVGSGNLLEPFKGYYLLGCDTEAFEPSIDTFWQDDFLTWHGDDYPPIDLVVTNPPYNHTAATARKWGRKNLLPELFAQKCFDLFGTSIKMVLITPMGLRLNTRCYTKKQGDRYRTMRDTFGKITSIVSLPLDTFPNPDFDPQYPEQRRNPSRFKSEFKGLSPRDAQVLQDPKKYYLQSNIKRKETHQEILFFNMPKLEPHYFLPDTVLQELRRIDTEIWEK